MSNYLLFEDPDAPAPTSDDEDGTFLLVCANSLKLELCVGSRLVAVVEADNELAAERAVRKLLQTAADAVN